MVYCSRKYAFYIESALKGSGKMSKYKGIEICGYAKINLHLDITGKMANGFHSVRTVMQSIDLYDKVRLTPRDDLAVTVRCNVEGVPCDRSNLAVRAVEEYFRVTGRRMGVDIEIEKNIPMAAGLAGGSADAAAALRAIFELDGGSMPIARLYGVASELGADVPFCIAGGTSYGEGKGDILRPMSAMPDCIIVVACGGEGVSTPAAYSLLDSRYSDFSEGAYTPHNLLSLRRALDDGDISALATSIYNIFEQPIMEIRPTVKLIKDIMLECGALGAMMSGSGPSVFGIYTDAEAAKRAAERISEHHIFAAVCAPKS